MKRPRPMNALLAAALLAAPLAAMSGCASTEPPPAGPTAEELVGATLHAMAAGAAAGDLNLLMQGFSDAFDHPLYRDKAAIREFLYQGIALGYLRDLEVDLAAAAPRIDGAAAHVGPVRVRGPFGNAELALALAPEGGAWRVVSMEVRVE